MTAQLHYAICSSDYIKSVDNSSGARRKNGSWSGVIGMMIKGEVQASNIPFVMTPDRESAVDFTFPLMDVRYFYLYHYSKVRMLCAAVFKINSYLWS